MNSSLKETLATRAQIHRRERDYGASRRIETILENLDLQSQEWFEKEHRTYLNNLRIDHKMNAQDSIDSLARIQLSLGENEKRRLQPWEVEYILKVFSERGDELSQRITQDLNLFSESDRLTVLNTGLAVIVQGLLMRRLTKEDYYGILEGKLPYATYKGDHCCLS